MPNVDRYLLPPSPISPYLLRSTGQTPNGLSQGSLLQSPRKQHLPKNDLADYYQERLVSDSEQLNEREVESIRCSCVLAAPGLSVTCLPPFYV